jgi:ribA/ribD-fused uncharacterized protein
MTVQQQLPIRFYRASGKYGFLSNLFKRPIRYDDRQFTCSETAYQFGKPVRSEVAEWLVSAPAPHLCAAAAHALLSFDITPNWNKVKVDRMRGILKEKFTQHKDLQEMLLETGNSLLIEESKTDAFWGIGKKGNGKNMLGVLLMEVRDEIRGECGCQGI